MLVGCAQIFGVAKTRNWLVSLSFLIGKISDRSWSEPAGSTCSLQKDVNVNLSTCFNFDTTRKYFFCNRNATDEDVH